MVYDACQINKENQDETKNTKNIGQRNGRGFAFW